MSYFPSSLQVSPIQSCAQATEAHWLCPVTLRGLELPPARTVPTASVMLGKGIDPSVVSRYRTYLLTDPFEVRLLSVTCPARLAAALTLSVGELQVLGIFGIFRVYVLRGVVDRVVRVIGTRI